MISVSQKINLILTGLLTTLLFGTAVVVGQDLAPGVIKIEDINQTSWKRGTDVIPPRQLRLILKPSSPTFEKNFRSLSGRMYRLRIPYYVDRAELWKVELREIFNLRRKKKRLGRDLLYVYPPGEPIGDDFGPADMAIFYPNDRDKVKVNGKYVWIANSLQYPSEWTRTMRIEGFLVVLRGGVVTYKDESKKAIKSFELFVEFRLPSAPPIKPQRSS